MHSTTPRLIRAATAALAVTAPLVPALANPVALESKVFVERLATDAAGKQRATLEAPKVVVPGDNLVFVLAYRNAGTTPAANFVVTNPLPAAVQFQAATDPQARVSVDGGRSWGQLRDLTVANTDGTRRTAQTSDVTHVRWAFATPIPVGAEGKVTFRGTVK